MRPFLTLLFSAGLLSAQNPYGRITGRVSDPHGALIPGASIRVTNIETNVSVSAVSNDAGNYEVPNLIPGSYRIVAQTEGFKRLERGPVELRVGDVLDIELKLEIGAVSESVTVTAEAPMLESATASLGQVVDHQRIAELPLPGSNVAYLTQLTPGVISTTAPTHGYMLQGVNSINDSVAGTAARSSEFMLDGIPNMTSQGRPALLPPPEMIQEVRIQTAPFDAAVGHFTGAQINMVFKTGTNQLHGNLAFMHTSRPLATKEFFTNRSLYDTTSGPVTKAKENQLFPPMLANRYHATAGGPLYLPRVYDGRNRTFWTYGFSMIARKFNNTNFWTVPTAAQRRGDFSALLAVGPQYQIYDPKTIAPAPNGRFSRQPLAGNVLPASRLDPIALRVSEYYPLPNVTVTTDGRGNYFSPGESVIHYHANVARVDQVFSERHRLYGSFTSSYDNEFTGQTFLNIARGNRSMRPYYGLALDDVLTLRPDLVVNVRLGVTRFTWDQSPPVRGFDITTLGLPASLAGLINRRAAQFPEFVVEAYTTLGRNSGDINPDTYYTLAGTVSHVRGTHSLRYGGEYRILRDNSYGYGYVSPRLEFSSQWTRGPVDNSPAAPIGQGMASFLLGLPSGGYVDRNASYAEQSKYLGLFLHDDWKATRKLTLNAGLRYEVELPTTERFNRANRGFDLTSPNPIEARARAAYARSPIPELAPGDFRTPGGLLFAGVNGAPRGLWDTDANNFSPRLGLAYLVRPRTVLRAGYGVYFGPLGADRNNVTQQGYSARTALTPSLDNGMTFKATLANPFPDGLLDPAGASAGLATFAGRAPSFFWPRQRNSYMQRWSFNVQQELPHRVLLEAGYMGNRGTGLDLDENFDALPARYLSKSGVRDQATIDFLSQQTPNPFAGLPEFAGSNLQGRNVSRSQLLLPFPQFTAVNTTTSSGFSWYHSLQARAEKRFSHGYTLQASYTWSKAMEAVQKLNVSDLHPHHVVSNLDRPHHLGVSGVYQFPVGRGRRWLGKAPGWLNQIAGGWSVQAIYQAQSGPPIAFGNVLFNGNVHDIVLPRPERRVERWFNTGAGFERDPRKQLSSNLRSFPLRLAGLRGDGYNNWDLSAYKEFHLWERMKFQLRAEAQDALNHAMFQTPNTDPASSLFGQVTQSIWGEQRRFSLGGKLTW